MARTVSMEKTEPPMRAFEANIHAGHRTFIQNIYEKNYASTYERSLNSLLIKQ